MTKKRVIIPNDIAAKVLFLSDRTCCICRQEGKKVQIHHIDEDPSNNSESNLSVLCFECHTDTMVKGGFDRKLDAEQIILYRNDWLNIVSRKRSLVEIDQEENETIDPIQLELATSVAEIYRENKEYELLAIHYNSIGNYELRDKYIDKVLSENPSDDSIIFLRSIQDRGSEIPREIVKRHVEKYKLQKDWLYIARIYKQANDPIESVKFYLKGTSHVLNQKNYFTTAFYLKELVENGLIEQLFRQAYNEAKDQDDLWWQIRALQELEWDTELENLILQNKDQILKSEDPSLLKLLAEFEKNEKEYIDLVKKEAMTKHLAPDDMVISGQINEDIRDD